jgi:hypothetical protein
VYNGDQLVTRIQLVSVVVVRSYSYVSQHDFWNVISSSLNGFWKHLTNQDVRDKFQFYVKNKVINQDILTRTMYGRVMMFALLDGLVDSLFTANKQFDTVEFVQNVGPALQVYHETLMELITEETKKSGSNIPTTPINGENMLNHKESNEVKMFLDGKLLNNWRTQATTDPTSLAGRFIKIVTEDNLNEQYQSAQTIKMFRSMGLPAPMEYVAGSCVVEYISLLNANAIEVDDELYQTKEHPEFAASDDYALPVLARIQVLYNLKRKFQRSKSFPVPSVSSTSVGESYKSINTDITEAPSSTLNERSTDTTNVTTISDVSTSSAENDNTTTLFNHDDQNHTYSETEIGVAIFEGWLNGGSSKNINKEQHQLRWKVASSYGATKFDFFVL